MRLRETGCGERSDGDGEPPAFPGASRGEGATRKPVGSVEAARPEVYNFRFSAGKELKEKLERLAEVLGIESSTGRMPEIIEVALDLALEKKDPQRKLARRRKREAARARARLDEATGARREGSSPSRRTGSAGVPPASGERALSAEAVARDVSRSLRSAGASIASSPREDSTTRDGRARSRYIPSVVRERVLERAGYRCEYTGPAGVRCTARAGLEIDHIHPHARGGSSAEENLRVLCGGHNRYSAVREFGEEFIRRKVEAGSARVSLF